jgi:uncharacterized protein YerC
MLDHNALSSMPQRLRTVRFVMGGKEYQAIEQNPEKPSRWGKLAREGRRVVQVRDLGTQKYVAAVVDGKVHGIFAVGTNSTYAVHFSST